MESELKTFDSKENEPLQAVHESSSKDDRPLLKSDSNANSPKVSGVEELEELEKKYAAYVRKDVYGTMGRGELPLVEKLLLGFAAVTLVPIRVVVSISILLIYYLICRICTISIAPTRDEEQEDYAHMGGWRRSVVVQCGRFLSRALLFTLGFYWISEANRNTDTAEILTSEVHISSRLQILVRMAIRFGGTECRMNHPQV